MKLRKLLPAALLLAAGLPLFAGPSADTPKWGWLPPNVNSAYGDTTDKLYLAIMWVVGIAFFLTEGALLTFIIVYRGRPGRKATYVHGSGIAELTWTVVPCGILIWLAVTQYDTWKLIRERFPKESEACTVQVFPEQFNWNFRYVVSNPDGSLDKVESCKRTSKSLYVPVNKPVLCKMTSKDVIHSFFIPFARVKQDVLPGMMTKVWFTIDRIPVFQVKWVSRQIKDGTGKVTPTYVGEPDPEASKDKYYAGFPGMLLWPAEEFARHQVALPQVWVEANGGGFRDRLLWTTVLTKDSDGQPNAHGYKESYYLPVGDKTTFTANGKLTEGSTRDAQFVYHHLEIACAELCGLGHTTMRTTMYPMPQEMFDEWMKHKVQAGPSEEVHKFEDIWDAHYPEYFNQADKSLDPQGRAIR